MSLRRIVTKIGLGVRIAFATTSAIGPLARVLVLVLVLRAMGLGMSFHQLLALEATPLVLHTMSLRMSPRVVSITKQRAWGGDDPRVSGWPQLQCTAAWRSAWVAQPHFAAPSRWQDRCPRRKRGHLRSE